MVSNLQKRHKDVKTNISWFDCELKKVGTYGLYIVVDLETKLIKLWLVCFVSKWAFACKRKRLYCLALEYRTQCTDTCIRYYVPLQRARGTLLDYRCSVKIQLLQIKAFLMQPNKNGNIFCQLIFQRPINHNKFGDIKQVCLEIKIRKKAANLNLVFVHFELLNAIKSRNKIKIDIEKRNPT